MLSKKELNKLKVTRDDDLLVEFPWYKRSELRRIKREYEDESPPKTLIFDIETSPIEAYLWHLWEQRVRPDQLKKDWFIISWSAMWLDWTKVFSEVLTPSEAKKWNDKRIVKELWKVIDEADIIVAHNLDKFDKLKANTRFLKHGLPHPSPYQGIDTLKVAKKEFKISSNKLDYLCWFLGIDRKTETWGLDLWKDCVAWDKKALKKMDEYCQNDVAILKKVYYKLRPYIRNHPNYGVYKNAKICPNCGNKKIEWKDTFKTNSNKFLAWRCKECESLVRMSWKKIVSVSK